MVPTAIVSRARSAGIEMIAICDHNSGENALAVARAGESESISVVPGMEITTREEVHILGLFGDQQNLMRMQALVDGSLFGENDADAFGLQVVVDERDQPIGISSKLLIGATTLTLEQVVDAIHEFGGLAIASHIDREGFGLIGQLGFIPPGIELDALEVSPRACRAEWGEERKDLPVITSSDAHRLDDIGRSYTSYLAMEPTVGELRKALAHEAGRRVLGN